MEGDELMKNLNPTREVWVDFCRVIAIFSIIYGHSFNALGLSNFSPWTGIIMGPFFDASAPCTAVLMFFFLSGWLQKVREKWIAWRQFVFLIVPLVIWNAVQIIISWESGEYTFGAAITQLGVIPHFGNANYPMWFLDELAWYSLFLPIFHRIPIKIRLLFILSTLWICNLYWPENWVLPRIGNSISFFLIGTIFQKIEREKVSAFFKDYSWLVVVCVVVMLYGPLFYEGSILKNLDYSPLYSICGCVAILSYGACAERYFSRVARWVASCAPAVFFAYASHVPCFTLYKKISEKYEIADLPAFYYPVYSLAFLILAICIFKLAIKIRCKYLLSSIFLYKQIRNK